MLNLAQCVRFLRRNEPMFKFLIGNDNPFEYIVSNYLK